MLVDAGGNPRRTAGRIRHLHVDRAISVTSRKQPVPRLHQPPVDTQDPQKLSLKHLGAVLAALAMPEPDHAAFL